MNDLEDDSWVREFDVSNPQRTHEGYTVYRVTSKVYPKGFPEAASEVIVFKRYSEFRALYKDLMVIYESKNVEKKKFPRFAKGHYFDRFDESVLEERMKQSLSLLVFAGNISFLFTSQPFVKFFEGGVEHGSRTSSHNSSDSEQASNDIIETSNETWIPERYFSEKQDSSDDETSYDRTDLTLKSEDEKTWLARAMTLCSEGSDIETLASEAGFAAEIEKCLITEDDLLKPDAQASQGSVDMLPTLLESSEEEEVFVETTSPKEEQIEGFVMLPAQDDISSENEAMKDTNNIVCSKELDDDTNQDGCSYDQELKNSEEVGESVSKEEINKLDTSVKPHKQVGRSVSNIAMSWIDPKKKDYLYHAAQIIQQALYCEANEIYEEAFNKYKICVGILLKGVQHDSDAKRREAVRRKTAQYLVKAEFLFNTYLKNDGKDEDDWSIQPQISSANLGNIVDQQFSHLTLASLKVIGVIGQNMLVQCSGLDGVFVVKVLHKTNAVHRSSRQENKQNKRKKYVKSPRMVQLHRHFDTNNSIFLLLEYAAGGCLWSHLKSLRKHLWKDHENVVLSHELAVEGLNACDRDSSRNSTNVVNTCNSEPIIDPLIGQPSNGTSLFNYGSSTSVNNETEKTMYNTPIEKNINTRERSGREACVAGLETCSDQDKEKASLEHKETCQTCPTSDILGFLDHMTMDYSALDKCIQRWIAELFLAINSVHSCGIILKDLKPSNVLLDGNGRVQLSYFGVWEEVDHSVDPEAVKHFYCAPEISRGEKITFASDWWSFGVLSYELITGKTLHSTHPWGIYPHSSIIFPSQDILPEARSFLSGLICHNSRERLGCSLDGVESIKSHAFFQGLDWKQLAS